MCHMCNAHEKSITEIIETNNKMTNGKLEKLPAEIRSNSDNVKYLMAKTKDLEESLTVNQDLIDNKIKSTINDELNKMKKLVNKDKTELKKQFRIQEDRSRINIRIDGIHEDENESREETEAKLRTFLFDEPEMAEDFYIEQAHRVARKKRNSE